MTRIDALSGERFDGAAGLPLVLLHAFPFDARMWAPQVQAFKGFRPILIPDLLGFGLTPLPEGLVSLDRQADALSRYLDEQGLDAAALCGLSMGGYIALAFAERHPEQVAALILADTRATADAEGVRAARTASAERVLREGVAGFAQEMVPRLLAEGTLRDRPQVAEQVVRIMGSQPPETVAAALLAMRDRPAREEVLKGTDRPVLVIVGEADAMTTPEEARSMVALCKHGRLALLPGAAHLSNLEAPEAFNAAVEAFLRRL